MARPTEYETKFAKKITDLLQRHTSTSTIVAFCWGTCCAHPITQPDGFIRGGLLFILLMHKARMMMMMIQVLRYLLVARLR
jgi:hypothetical protein